MAKTMILPAALEYQHRLASTIGQTKAVIGSLNLSGEESLLRDLCSTASELHNSIDVLDSLIKGNKDNEHGESDAYAHARFYRERVIPAMDEVRTAADHLETIVDDSLWPLPKFREMLYIY